MIANDNSRFQTVSSREKIVAAVFFALVNLATAATFWQGNPCGHDTATHFWRTVQFTFNIRAGYPFLQWGPHFLRGYGYPIFPFYAPLYNWLIAVMHLAGLDFNVALRLAAWLAFFLCGWSMYLLARRYVRTPQAAATAGLAYMFAPYTIYDGVERGAFPELFALALLPWVLARVDIAMAARTRRTAVQAVFAFAILILTHNVVPIIGFLLVGALWLGRLENKQWAKWLHEAKTGVLIILAGLLVTAFFWLPALIELEDTQQGRANPPAFVDQPVWYQHFLPEAELMTLPADPADPQLGNPPLVRTLGIPQVVLAGLGLITLLWHQPRRGIFVMWAVIAATAVYLSNANANWLWDLLPLQTFIQLPTRLLGIAGLGPAVLVGRLVDELQQLPRRVGYPTTAVVAVTVCMVGWPWLVRPYCPLPDNPDVQALAQAARWNDAQQVRSWGGANGAETLPRWADALPEPDGLMPQYEAGGPVNRLVPTAAATLLNWDHNPAGDHYRLRLERPITATYRAFYMPGWRATVNGTPIPITPAESSGFITVPLPAGEVEMQVWFSRTPLRRTMIVISLLAAGGLIWFGRRRERSRATMPFAVRETAVFLAGCAVLILGVRTAVALTDNPLQATRLEDGRLALTDLSHNIVFSNQLINLGLNGDLTFPADEGTVITQYWTPVSGIGVGYDFGMRIADEHGRQWNLPTQRPVFHTGIPGVYGWRDGVYVRDPYRLNLRPGTPPGTYWLETTVFRRDITFALTAENAPTAPDPAWARLTPITVLPPTTPIQLTPETASVDTLHRQNLAAHPPLTLYGSSLITFPPVRPYDELVIELLWQTDGPAPTTAVTVPLTLHDEDGRIVVTESLPVGGDYTTDQWPPDAVVRQQTGWNIPRNLESGLYEARLDGIRLGTFEAVAPDRQTTPPEMGRTADVHFEFARLLGYTVPATSAPGQPFTLDLVWRAEETTETNYRVFIHLRGEDGTIVAQSDAEPAGWTRRTRSWLPPEIIVDAHTLTPPADTAAGVYQLVIGLYDPATMARLGEAELSTIEIR